MKQILFMLLLALLSMPMFSQINVFERVNGEIVAKSQFVSLEQEDKSTLTQFDNSLYKCNTYKMSTPNNLYHCYLNVLGYERNLESTRMYDALSLTYENGNLMFFRFGYESMADVYWLTLGTDRNYYIRVPLDNDSYALIFAGALYSYDDVPGEMLIVVVNKGLATRVYDGYAIAYSYTPAPNFSIEFVSTLNGVTDANSNPVLTTERVANKQKHRIWREGNMLKYVTWK